MVNQFFWQSITRLLEHMSSRERENCRGLESGPERGGTGYVIELAMAKQDYKKSWSYYDKVLVSQKSNSFDPNSLFLPGFVLFNWYSLRRPCSIGSFRVPVFYLVFFWKVEINVSVVFFCLKSSNCFPVKTHLFGRSFIFFVYFVYNDGALNLRLKVVALPASVTMSWPAKTT